MSFRDAVNRASKAISNLFSDFMSTPDRDAIRKAFADAGLGPDAFKNVGPINALLGGIVGFMRSDMSREEIAYVMAILAEPETTPAEVYEEARPMLERLGPRGVGLTMLEMTKVMMTALQTHSNLTATQCLFLVGWIMKMLPDMNPTEGDMGAGVSAMLDGASASLGEAVVRAEPEITAKYVETLRKRQEPLEAELTRLGVPHRRMDTPCSCGNPACPSIGMASTIRAEGPKWLADITWKAEEEDFTALVGERDEMEETPADGSDAGGLTFWVAGPAALPVMFAVTVATLLAAPAPQNAEVASEVSEILRG